MVFPWAARAHERALIQSWSKKLLAILGVELKIAGIAPNCDQRATLNAPAMLVANHVSWLDIFAINAVCPARFVSKSEVRSWPVVGWLCEKSGTLFIARSTRADVKRINAQIKSLLGMGEVVAIFPEGMTTAGERVAPFHASLLQAALGCNAGLWPVAVRYLRPDGSASSEAAFAGDLRFDQSLRAIAGQPRIIAELIFTDAIATAGFNRGQLSSKAHQQIVTALDPRTNRRPETPVYLPA